jgi:hypothetical protein
MIMYVNILDFIRHSSFLKQRFRDRICLRPQVNKIRGSYSGGSLRKTSLFSLEKTSFFKGTQQSGTPFFFNLRTETDPVSEMLCFKNQDDG